jgi:hypothetical protein
MPSLLEPELPAVREDAAELVIPVIDLAWQRDIAVA